MYIHNGIAHMDTSFFYVPWNAFTHFPWGICPRLYPVKPPSALYYRSRKTVRNYFASGDKGFPKSARRLVLLKISSEIADCTPIFFTDVIRTTKSFSYISSHARWRRTTEATHGYIFKLWYVFKYKIYVLQFLSVIV